MVGLMCFYIYIYEIVVWLCCMKEDSTGGLYSNSIECFSFFSVVMPSITLVGGQIGLGIRREKTTDLLRDG